MSLFCERLGDLVASALIVSFAGYESLISSQTNWIRAFSTRAPRGMPTPLNRIPTIWKEWSWVSSRSELPVLTSPPGLPPSIAASV